MCSDLKKSPILAQTFDMGDEKKQHTDTDASVQLSAGENDTANAFEKSSSTAAADQQSYISGPKLWAVTAAVTMVVFLMLLDMSIISTVSWIVAEKLSAISPCSLLQAIPKITTEFHSLQDIGWYGSAYNLAA
jgi:hypothetical protein